MPGKQIPNDNESTTAEFNADFLSPQGDGTYHIDLIGNKLASYNIHLTVSSQDTTRAQDAQFNILESPIEKDSVVSYLFTYHQAPGSPVRFAKIVSVTSLIQDVTVMRKLGWIKDQGTINKYINHFSSAKLQLGRTDYKGARAILEKVLIDTNKDRMSRKLTGKAFKLIHSDTANLMTNLPGS